MLNWSGVEFKRGSVLVVMIGEGEGLRYDEAGILDPRYICAGCF